MIGFILIFCSCVSSKYLYCGAMYFVIFEDKAGYMCTCTYVCSHTRGMGWNGQDLMGCVWEVLCGQVICYIVVVFVFLLFWGGVVIWVCASDRLYSQDTVNHHSYLEVIFMVLISMSSMFCDNKYNTNYGLLTTNQVAIVASYNTHNLVYTRCEGVCRVKVCDFVSVLSWYTCITCE